MVLLLSVLVLSAAAPPHLSRASASSSIPIKHIVIIVEENHTFDNYFGTYPGANGLSGAMPQPVAQNSSQYLKPFEINTKTVWANPCESWVCAHEAYDSGKMDGFAVANGGSNLTMGYFNPDLIPYYWDLASQYVLMDDFFTSAMTNSLANHLYLVAGQSGGLVNDSRFGAFNFTSSTVHENTFYFKSIADELDASHTSWRYYAGGYGSLNNWNPMPAFESFKSSPAMANNTADPSQFFTDVKGESMPSVAWIMPESDWTSEHAPYDISVGERAVVSIINATMASQYWNSTAIFLTWDDWGGWYDHVRPPQVDALGYGFRVPCMMISPYAKQGFIDHTQGDFTSLLKLIETVHSLPPLTPRDAAANSLMEAFDFSQAPRPPMPLPGQFVPDHYPLTFLNGTVLKGPGFVSQAIKTTSTSTIRASSASTLKVSSSSSASTSQSLSQVIAASTVGSSVPSADTSLATVLVTVLAAGCAILVLSTRRKRNTP